MRTFKIDGQCIALKYFEMKIHERALVCYVKESNFDNWRA